MINICISRLVGCTDYSVLGNPGAYESGELRRHPVVFDYKSFFRKNDNVLSLIIKGDAIASIESGQKFLEFFNNDNQNELHVNGKTELTWFIGVIKDIINKIDEDFYNEINDKNKANLFIHWGGRGGYQATVRLKETARKFSFPFNIYPWSTSNMMQEEMAERIKDLFELNNRQKIMEYTAELVTFLR